MKFILDDAAAHNYGVIAAAPMNMETAKGIAEAAYEAASPLIFLLGQNIMKKHAPAELMVPLLKSLADKSPYPIAICLDHGSEYERITYAFRNGFSAIMYDGSSLPIEENIANTRRVVELCHQHGITVEGEVGHVGQAIEVSETYQYTNPDEAKYYVESTGVDCIAIAAGTAHGNYPKGYIPKINFELIRNIKTGLGYMPMALHGASGSGDDNIRKAVEAGINKINVATDIFNAARNCCTEMLCENHELPLLEVLKLMEQAARKVAAHYIALSGSTGMGKSFSYPDNFASVYPVSTVLKGE
jgi:fructose-bisphosphate aldolase class II